MDLSSEAAVPPPGRRRAAQVIRTFLLIAVSLFFVTRTEALEPLKELVERTHPFEGITALSIHNTDGSVAVRAGDVTEISIRAIKKAYTLDRLKSIVVDVRATSDCVTVETMLPPKKGVLTLEDRSGTVDYVIAIPKTMRITRLDLNNGEASIEGLRGGSATARVGNGWLVARNCFGDLDLNVTNGRLQVAYDWWEDAEFRVKLSSAEGDIRANFPRDAAVGIVAQTVTGRIVNGLSKQENESEPSRVLNLTVGQEPRAVFEMSAMSGDIRINKPY